jgi:D-glycero-D-manno-heptose 1,7-bisphosphate phosphatase
MPLKVERLGDLQLIPGVDDAVARLCQSGFICPVVTVQSRIAKGVFSENDFRHWFERFAQQMQTRGAQLQGPYVCPHRFNESCACEKPNTLLYEQAATEYDIDLHNSFVIGDSAFDVCAAHRFGGQGCLVKTGWATSQIEAEVERAAPYAAYIAESLPAAVDWILS